MFYFHSPRGLRKYFNNKISPIYGTLKTMMKEPLPHPPTPKMVSLYLGVGCLCPCGLCHTWPWKNGKWSQECQLCAVGELTGHMHRRTHTCTQTQHGDGNCSLSAAVYGSIANNRLNSIRQYQITELQQQQQVQAIIVYLDHKIT